MLFRHAAVTQESIFGSSDTRFKPEASINRSYKNSLTEAILYSCYAKCWIAFKCQKPLCLQPFYLFLLILLLFASYVKPVHVFKPSCLQMGRGLVSTPLQSSQLFICPLLHRLRREIAAHGNLYMELQTLLLLLCSLTAWCGKKGVLKLREMHKCFHNTVLFKTKYPRGNSLYW